MRNPNARYEGSGFLLVLPEEENYAGYDDMVSGQYSTGTLGTLTEAPLHDVIIGPWQYNYGEIDKNNAYNNWGIPLSQFSGLSFVLDGHKWEMKPTWQQVTVTKKNPTTGKNYDEIIGVGYPVYFDGNLIDHTKYLWIANGKVYAQDAITPWQYNTQAAGNTKLYTVNLFPNQFVQFLAVGKVNPAQAFTIDGVLMKDWKPLSVGGGSTGGGTNTGGGSGGNDTYGGDQNQTGQGNTQDNTPKNPIPQFSLSDIPQSAWIIIGVFIVLLVLMSFAK